MKDMDWLKLNYVGFLTERQEHYQVSMDRLYQQQCVDEANFEKIRLNVVEIFSKMFKISSAQNPEALKTKYLSFFDKITTPWHLNREKALEFGRDRERFIEDLKTQEAEVLRLRFEEYFSQIDTNLGCSK